MRWRKTKLGVSVKLALIGLVISMTFGCQNQTVSPEKTVSPSANVNSANQSNSAVKVSEPRDVKYESAEKTEIVGTFYESPKENSPAVLLLHQFGSDRKSFDAFARKMQARGFSVLAIDGRGFGESTKTADGKTIAPARDTKTVAAMRADVDNAFQFLAKQKNVDASRIGIVGASYGSSLAIIYAAENKQVKAVALLSPGTNYFGTLPTEPAVKNYGGRALLMVAAEDDKESAEAVRKLKAVNAGEKCETQIYEKGGHGTDIFAAEVGLENALELFLTQSL